MDQASLDPLNCSVEQQSGAESRWFERGVKETNNITALHKNGWMEIHIPFVRDNIQQKVKAGRLNKTGKGVGELWL